MPQDLIEKIENKLTPFDFEPTEDVQKLEDRMETAIDLMEQVFAEAIN